MSRGIGIEKYDSEGRVPVTEHEEFCYTIFIFQMDKKTTRG